MSKVSVMVMLPWRSVLVSGNICNQFCFYRYYCTISFGGWQEGDENFYSKIPEAQFGTLAEADMDLKRILIYTIYAAKNTKQYYIMDINWRF